MECIILAGGKGTRLAGVVKDVPKCMADVNGRPFLDHLMEYLEQQQVQHVILSLGYMHEHITNWLKGKAFLFKVSWVIERESLGTGGGIKLALKKAKTNRVIVVNGDTLFKINVRDLYKEDLSDMYAAVALKKMEEFDRYGRVSLDDSSHITEFHEKEYCREGLINGGTYILNLEKEDLSSYPDMFSFEKDYLEKVVVDGKLKGKVYDDYFIDIGIPEDYEKIKRDLSHTGS